MSDARDPARLSELVADAPELAAAIRSVRAEQTGSAQLEALIKLKRRSAARARAAAFVQAYPDSAHVRRVRGLLELVPAPPPTQPTP